MTTNLFGNQNQTSLFGNPNQNQQNQTQNTTSLFGNQTQTTSLFGNQTQNQPTTLFGNQNQNQPTTLFGNQNQNQPTTLFGNQNQTNFFGQNQNNQFNINNNLNNQNLNMNMFPQINQYPLKSEMDENQIKNIMQNFLASLDTSNPANIFKFFLYSKIPQNKDPRFFQNYIPLIQYDDGSNNFIDYNLWKKASLQNPNPMKYFPVQISSPKQFLIRLRRTEVNVLYFLEEIIKMQKNLEDMNNKEQKEINKELQLAREKVKKIKNLITLVSTELAQLSLKTGKYQKDLNIEKKIDDKLKSINNKINSDSDIRRKINLLKNTPFENSPFTEGEPNYIKGMSKGRVERNLSVLKELKGVLDIQFNHLKKNIKIVQGIQNDLNKMNLNGKI
jgi:hypothetical protein